MNCDTQTPLFKDKNPWRKYLTGFEFLQQPKVSSNIVVPIRKYENDLPHAVCESHPFPTSCTTPLKKRRVALNGVKLHWRYQPRCIVLIHERGRLEMQDNAANTLNRPIVYPFTKHEANSLLSVLIIFIVVLHVSILIRIAAAERSCVAIINHGCGKMQRHILLISIPAYGHLIPLLELAKKIAIHHQVTFAVSHSKAGMIHERELLTDESISIISIPDNYYELPDENPLSGALFNRMWNALIPAVAKLLSAMPVNDKQPRMTTKNPDDSLGIVTPVDVVITDTSLAAALTQLPQRNVPFYLFNTAAADFTLYALLISLDTPSIPDEDLVEIPFDEIPQPGATPPPIMQVFKKILLATQAAIPLAAGIIENELYELENKVVKTIREHERMKKVDIFCVAPLVPDESFSSVNSKKREAVKKWLDAQENSSMIYISFGTLALPKAEDLCEIVKGLVALRRPFIWSLRQKEHSRLPTTRFRKAEISVKCELDSILSARDSLILDWVPQILILQHPATVVFVSHCGWNSSFESLVGGVPLVAWPMFGDQKLNALGLVSRGVAVLVEGTGMTSKKVVSAEEFRAAILEASGSGLNAEDTSGKRDYRKAAQEWKEILVTATVSGGGSWRDLQRLVKF